MLWLRFIMRRIFFRMLLVVRVVVFIVAGMDMWRHFAIGRRKLRRLRLAILLGYWCL
jgi:hypothetical protein